MAESQNREKVWIQVTPCRGDLSEILKCTSGFLRFCDFVVVTIALTNTDFKSCVLNPKAPTSEIGFPIKWHPFLQQRHGINCEAAREKPGMISQHTTDLVSWGIAETGLEQEKWMNCKWARVLFCSNKILSLLANNTKFTS